MLNNSTTKLRYRVTESAGAVEATGGRKERVDERQHEPWTGTRQGSVGSVVQRRDFRVLP